MDISRRHFLLGTAGAAAGLILPSYYRRALEFIDRAGRPLLEPAGRPKIELIAVPSPDWTDLAYALTVGNPYAGPPPMTLRQFSDRYEIDLYANWYLEPDEVPDWDEPIDWSQEFFFDTWVLRDSPDKLAYELLSNLDLGPQLAGPNAVGELKVEEGHTMVSTYWDVGAADDISLSLLQERLNALNTGVKIVMS